jgi:hypothetical protein
MVEHNACGILWMCGAGAPAREGRRQHKSKGHPEALFGGLVFGHYRHFAGEGARATSPPRSPRGHGNHRRPRPHAELRNRRSESSHRRTQPDRGSSGGVGAVSLWEEDSLALAGYRVPHPCRVLSSTKRH